MMIYRPVDMNLPATYQKLNRAEVLEFLRQNKQQERFVPEWIETNNTERLQQLSSIIQQWMESKVPQQATATILQIAQSRKGVFKPTIQDKNIQVIGREVQERKLRLDSVGVCK